MKPIPNWQSEGRANPRGIPYLYLATTRETALAEVRPWVGSRVSIAQFKINRNLNLIDCSRRHAGFAFLALIGDKNSSREDGIWASIDEAFATPVSREDEAGEYIPTQILAEMFNQAGFDGILYKSLLAEDGLNVALFRPSDADVVNCTLYSVGGITFKFQPEGPQYFVHAK